MWWAYLLAAFFGGVVALAALVVALGLLCKTTGTSHFTFGRGFDMPEEYHDLKLIESAVRPGGVYVRYENTGQKVVDTVHFSVRVFDSDNQLIAETDGRAQSLPGPGETAETILETHEIEADWLHAPDHRVEVGKASAFIVSTSSLV